MAHDEADDTDRAADGGTDPHGPASSVGERLTGTSDPKDPDGLLTLDDLPDPASDVSDLGALIAKTRSYGDEGRP